MRTREQEEKFVIEMIRVQLEFARDISKQLLMPFSDAINDFTMIQEFTDFNTSNLFGWVDRQDSSWINVLQTFRIENSNEGIISDMLPLIQNRITKNLKEFEGMYKEKWSRDNSCIGLNLQGTNAEMHVHNNFYPESFLDFSLERDIKKMLSTLPVHIETISCCTWLNDVPRFYKHFPESYKKSETWYDHYREPGLGIFGQFINKNYEANMKTIGYYVENRKLKYLMKNCVCSVKDLKAFYEF